MFGLFKKKNPIEQLEKEHKKLLEEAFKLQSVDRRKSDTKYAEAEKIAQKIEELKEKQ